MTVIVLLPIAKLILVWLHEVVPVAVPNVGVQVGQAHMTELTAVSSEAVPDIEIVAPVPLLYGLTEGDIIVIVGLVVSSEGRLYMIGPMSHAFNGFPM